MTDEVNHRKNTIDGSNSIVNKISGEQIKSLNMQDTIDVDEGATLNKDDDDEFDDFNEDNNDDNDDDGDSDFGSFDDASFNDFEAPIVSSSTDITPSLISKDYTTFTEKVLSDTTKFNENLESLMNNIFRKNHRPSIGCHKINDLLSERAIQIFHELSKLPHLKPPKWIKSKIRHNLLIELGIPINLDEISKESRTINDAHSASTISRTKSINAKDINWDDFNIPDISTLNVSDDEKTELISKSAQILSRIETDNLSNSSKHFLEDSNNEEILDLKLQQFNQNFNELIKLSSVWNNHLKELIQNFEIYENVVQNFIGYSQKLRREEIFDNLNKLKSKSRRSKRKSFWK